MCPTKSMASQLGSKCHILEDESPQRRRPSCNIPMSQSHCIRHWNMGAPVAAPWPLAGELPAHTIKSDPKVQHDQRVILIVIWGDPQTSERHFGFASDGRHDHGPDRWPARAANPIPPLQNARTCTCTHLAAKDRKGSHAGVCNTNLCTC